MQAYNNNINQDYSWTLPADQGKDSDYFANLAAFLQERPAGQVIQNHVAPYEVGALESIPPLDACNSASSPESQIGATHTPEEIPVEPQTTTTKRKTAADPLKPRGSIKDNRRKGSDEGLHTHDDGESTDKKKTSDRRKEQNRNAQRAFRERRENYARTLEAQIASLEEAAKARDAENASLKELVGRLQTEHSRTQSPESSFTFNVSPTTHSLSGPSLSNDNLNPGFNTAALSSGPPTAFSTKANVGTPAGRSSSGSSNPLVDPSFGFFSTYQPAPFMPNGILAPLTPPSSGGEATPPNGLDEPLFGGEYQFYQSQSAMSDLFTPNGGHLNPFNSLSGSFATDVLGDPSTTVSSSVASPSALADDTWINALSPGSTEVLFSTYRDPVVDEVQESDKSSSFTTATTSPPTGLRNTANPEATLVKQEPNDECREVASKIQSLPGAEKYDIEALCSDMFKKATCREQSRQMMTKIQDEKLDIDAFFDATGRALQFSKQG